MNMRFCKSHRRVLRFARAPRRTLQKNGRKSTAGFSIIEVIVSLALLLMLSALGETAVRAGQLQRQHAVDTLAAQQTAREQLYTGDTGAKSSTQAVIYSFTKGGQNVTLNLDTYTISTHNGTTYQMLQPKGGSTP